MFEVRNHFIIVSQEIEDFYVLLEFLTTNRDDHCARCKANQMSNYKTLKSLLLLSLYNILESTVRNSIIALYDVINDMNLSYPQLSTRLQKRYIGIRHCNTIGKLSTDNISNVFNSINLTLSGNVRFEKCERLIANGNLNYSKIIEICDTHGIKLAFSVSKQDKQLLHQLKEHRNSLAHGHTSFSTGACNITLSELLNYKTATLNFCSNFIDTMSEFITNNEFRLVST